MDDIVKTIAEKFLSIPSLETRNRDHLDFYGVAVWQVKAALEEAFKAGQRSMESNESV